MHQITFLCSLLIFWWNLIKQLHNTILFICYVINGLVDIRFGLVHFKRSWSDGLAVKKFMSNPDRANLQWSAPNNVLISQESKRMYFQDFQVFAMWNFIPRVVEPLPKNLKLMKRSLKYRENMKRIRDSLEDSSFLFINAQYIVNSPESKLNFMSNNIVGPLESWRTSKFWKLVVLWVST